MPQWAKPLGQVGEPHMGWGILLHTYLEYIHVCPPQSYQQGGCRYLNSPGLGQGRVRSQTSRICFSNCFNTFCFSICFSFQQSTLFSNPFSFLLQWFSNPIIFCTNLESVSPFSARSSNSASTAARTIVSCLNSAHARLLLQGPPDLGIGCCLNLVGHLCLKHSLKLFFFIQNYELLWK